MVESVSKMTFTWTISNFDLYPNRFGKHLKSPEFSLYSSHMPKFRLMLYPRGINRDTSSFVSLYLVKCSDEVNNKFNDEVNNKFNDEVNNKFNDEVNNKFNDEVNNKFNDEVNNKFNDEVNKKSYSCELGVVKSDGKRMSCKKFSNPFFLEGIGDGSPKLIRREDLMLTDGNLTIFCEIFEKYLKRKQQLYRSVPSATGQDLTELSESFTKLYESQQHCDFDLLTPEKKFKVHKAILQARFPELLENASGDSCSVENVRTDTMDILLRYLYSGTLDESQMSLFDFMKYARKIPSQLKSLAVLKIRNIHVITSLKHRVLSFTWNIQNLHTLKPDKTLQYSLIGDEMYSWTWFNISLSVSVTEANEETLAFTIERYTNVSSRVICKIKVFDLCKTLKHTFEKENRWTFPAFMTMKELTENKPPSDEVNIHIEISVTDGSVTNETQSIEFYPVTDTAEEKENHLTSFKKDLEKLLSDLKFSDVTLIAGDDKFPAHKSVLCARSSVFAELFQNDSSESDTVVTELDSSVVKKLLSYIYYGDVGLHIASTKDVAAMYAAAKKYDVPGLKSKCASKLKSYVREENAGEILVSAQDWGDKDLKDFVYEFVLSHPQKIVSSDKWRETMLKRSDVALEMLNRALSYIASKK